MINTMLSKILMLFDIHHQQFRTTLLRNFFPYFNTTKILVRSYNKRFFLIIVFYLVRSPPGKTIFLIFESQSERENSLIVLSKL
ncbi:hypothetical protein BpHYR1_046545 [Brachionus plicatilis]|uniref:Uncharacterized protein n=1 Tax=Brachionus plicatilis TaxID=10195 RepID=A0A3M7RFI8_BRAPC|nr:hypothetical protein BpHYR1_046545 [Brachionus plicatilis]